MASLVRFTAEVSLCLEQGRKLKLGTTSQVVHERIVHALSEPNIRVSICEEALVVTSTVSAGQQCGMRASQCTLEPRILDTSMAE